MLATRLIGATSIGIEYVGAMTRTVGPSTSNLGYEFLNFLTGGLSDVDGYTINPGDLVVVYFATGSTADRNLVASGYTEIVELYANDTFDTNLVVAYKFMGATPDTGITIIGGTISANDAGALVVQIWRGVDTVTPLDVSEKTTTGIDTALPALENITPVTPGAIILAGAASAHSRGVQTYSSSNLTDFRSRGNGSTQGDVNDVTVGLGYHVWTSGQFTPDNFTFSGTDSTSFSYASCVLALRPV